MQIALVSADQSESLVDLLCELHAFYNDPTTATRESVQEHLLQNLLGIHSPVRLIVATHPERGVVGFAAIVLLYSLVDPKPESRRQCQVKELFVRSSARSQGVGRALMAWVARYALEQGCGRIDWNVKVSNSEGIFFYESLGAQNVIDRLSYRLSKTSMVQLANQSDGGQVDG